MGVYKLNMRSLQVVFYSFLAIATAAGCEYQQRLQSNAHQQPPQVLLTERERQTLEAKGYIRGKKIMHGIYKQLQGGF